jgi:hypothetical protein
MIIQGTLYGGDDFVPLICDENGYLLVKLVNPTAPSVDVDVTVPPGEVPESQVLLVDSITGALSTIPVVHHEVHEGETFEVSWFDANVANNGVLAILLQVGNTHSPHLTFNVACGGDCQVELIEGPTVNAAGTPLVISNMHRQGGGASSCIATHTPNVAGGDVLLNIAQPGGSGPHATGSTTRSNVERVLHRGWYYLIRGTNLSGGAQIMSVQLGWYEESMII